MPHRPPHHRRVPSSAVLAFADPAALEAALAPLVPDAQDRAFLVRCVVAEGPAHHRGANWVLLSLLARAVEAAGAWRRVGKGAPGLAVPMHLPPHLRGDDQSYPLTLPEGPLRRLAPDDARAREAMVDCLTDGPPQHAVANVMMAALLGALLEELEKP